MKTTIIAEAGVNHNGQLSKAKKMIEIAAKSGADYIKFQIFSANNLATKKSIKAKYVKKNMKSKISNFQMLKKLEFSFTKFQILKKLCKKNNINFLLSPFSIEDVKLIKRMNLSTIKIPSGEINNIPFLRFIGSLKKKIIMSTGMSNIFEIKRAIDTLTKSGTNKKKITLLQCNTEYPTPYRDVNLLGIKFLKNKFNVKVGYSDHTIGYEASIAAVALGAEVIEKHFTLNKNLPGPDHKSSLNYEELKKMIFFIRNVEKALGKYEKKITKSEKKNLKIVRKSIVTIKKIKKGDKFTISNLSVKRPGTGISPVFWDKLIGKKAKKNYQSDKLISSNEI